MLIPRCFFLILCTCGGAALSAGYVAFITMLGVFDKLIEHTKSGRFVYILESFLILGVALGNAAYVLQWQLPFGGFGFCIFLLFGGIFTGCLAGALAETLKVFPILSRRFSMRTHLPYILIAAAVGKAIGCAIDILFL